jgi:pyrroloquinoline quinone biosynthesis protein D
MNTPLPAPVTDDARPRLAPMYRLQFEPAQDCWVLLYPEGLVKLNGPASEILKRCSGQASVADLTADLEQAFNQPGLRGDVGDFLADALARGWIV